MNNDEAHKLKSVMRKAQLLERALMKRDKEFLELRSAAQAVMDRWYTPMWKDREATSTVIYQLEAALAGAELLSVRMLLDQSDEIERLRDALELLLVSSDDIYPGDVAIARAALGKENV